MQFKINLATKTYINRKKVNIALAAALAVLLLLLLLQAKIAAYNYGEIDRLNAALTTAEPGAKKQVRAFSEKDYEKMLADIKFANVIIERKTYDWVGLLNRLENVVPAGLTLTSVKPDSKEQKLSLSGKSLNLQNIRKLMERLEESDFFTEVYLHNQDESGDPGEPTVISFSITCKFDSRNL